MRILSTLHEKTIKIFTTTFSIYFQTLNTKSTFAMNQQTKWSQFGVLISVFFFWGFVAASNDILIPVFKEKLSLEQWQGQMISFAFYVAYTVGSLLYLGISKMIGGDILNRIGYKNGIAIGLIISALGTLLFIPAANSASFPLLISGLFIVGLGFSLQQTAANPLAIVMGNPKTGAQRLSLAGGVNNLGTTIGPVLVNLAIFGSLTGLASVASISSVKVPYLILGAAFLLAALVFKFSSVPNKINLDVPPTEAPTDISTDLSKLAKDGSLGTKLVDRGSPTKYPQLVLGMIGIFVYVGVEVSTAANLPEFMKRHLSTPTDRIAPFVSLFWASLMIGRWTAATGVFGLKGIAQQIMKIVMPYIAFSVFILINMLVKHDITPFYYYPAVIVVMIIGDFLSKGNPARQLLIFSTMGITALIVGMLADGMVSVYAFMSVGLFCSTLWPCIFTLSIAGLGKHTSQGANLLIMMIMGGGFLSVLQGALADKVTGIQYSYIVGVACFAYLAFYAIRSKAILKEQGIDYDKLEADGGH
jgi:FHS family L-fucose permease-like MFS transporter